MRGLECALEARIARGHALGLRRRADGLFHPRDSYSEILNETLKDLRGRLSEARQELADIETRMRSTILTESAADHTAKAWSDRRRGALLVILAALGWAISTYGVLSLIESTGLRDSRPMAVYGGSR